MLFARGQEWCGLWQPVYCINLLYQTYLGCIFYSFSGVIGDNVFEHKPVLVALVSVDIAVINLHLLRNRVAVVVAFCSIRNAVARGIVSRTRLRRTFVSTSVLQYHPVNSLTIKMHNQLHSRGLPCIAYRVAQNKIPHQRICNISATSGLILKFLKLLNPDTSLNLTVYNVSTAYNHTTV